MERVPDRQLFPADRPAGDRRRALEVVGGTWVETRLQLDLGESWCAAAPVRQQVLSREVRGRHDRIEPSTLRLQPFGCWLYRKSVFDVHHPEDLVERHDGVSISCPAGGPDGTRLAFDVFSVEGYIEPGGPGGKRRRHHQVPGDHGVAEKFDPVRGLGDHGGGPNRRDPRPRPPCCLPEPPVVPTCTLAGDFLKQILGDLGDRILVWADSFIFSAHRGTFTSQAQVSGTTGGAKRIWARRRRRHSARLLGAAHPADLAALWQDVLHQPVPRHPARPITLVTGITLETYTTVRRKLGRIEDQASAAGGAPRWTRRGSWHSRGGVQSTSWSGPISSPRDRIPRPAELALGWRTVRPCPPNSAGRETGSAPCRLRGRERAVAGRMFVARPGSPGRRSSRSRGRLRRSRRTGGTAPRGRSRERQIRSRTRSWTASSKSPPARRSTPCGSTRTSRRTGTPGTWASPGRVLNRRRPWNPTMLPVRAVLRCATTSCPDKDRYAPTEDFLVDLHPDHHRVPRARPRGYRHRGRSPGGVAPDAQSPSRLPPAQRDLATS